MVPSGKGRAGLEELRGCLEQFTLYDVVMVHASHKTLVQAQDTHLQSCYKPQFWALMMFNVGSVLALVMADGNRKIMHMQGKRNQRNL